MKVLAAVLAGAVAAGPAAPVPAPPPAPRVAAPDGGVPAAAPDVRLPQRCAPPPADDGPDAGGAAPLALPAVREIGTGAGQVIAVIDTGVAPHPRLGSRLAGGGDYLTGGDGLDDCDGHGTAVAGLLAAEPGPDGVAGIAPGARLVSIRHTSRAARSDTGPVGTVETLAAAVVRAVLLGADVVNISEAVCVPADAAAAAGAPLHAALRLAAEADVVVVAAAGNDGVGGCTSGGAEDGLVALPGWYDEVLTVGATAAGDEPATFTVPGPWVDVAAPGAGLRSLAVGGGTTGSGVAGTSFAAPWVAGLAALVRARHPDLPARAVVDRILATARPAPGGRSAALGHGVVDPVAALTARPTRLGGPGARGAAVAAAPLAGTDPVPAPPPSPGWPPYALALLLATGSAAALALRRPRRF